MTGKLHLTHARRLMLLFLVAALAVAAVVVATRYGGTPHDTAFVYHGAQPNFVYHG